MSVLLQPVYKTPEGVLDYTLDWGNAADSWLAAGETIVSAVWSCVRGQQGQAPDLSILGSEIKNGTKTVVWLQGGTLNQDYQVKVVVTTNSTPVARMESKILHIKVRNR